jgi:hypothetical protein
MLGMIKLSRRARGKKLYRIVSARAVAVSNRQILGVQKKKLPPTPIDRRVAKKITIRIHARVVIPTDQIILAQRVKNNDIRLFFIL